MLRLSYKRDIELKAGEEVALDFISKTKDLYRKHLLAGSIRRKESIVHDVDIAVVPGRKDFAEWRNEVTRRVEKIGGVVATFGDTISGFRYRGVQVNLFICLDERAWGATQMWATGPKGHTIGMTIKARNRGMTINSKGLWTRDEPPKLIPARTEEDVGRLLGWAYKPPEARGKGSSKRVDLP